MTYYIDVNKKKKYLNNFACSKEEFLKKKRLANIFFILGGIIFAGFIIAMLILSGGQDVVSCLLMGFVFGLILAIIFYAIGNTIKTKAFNDAAFPFAKMSKESLCLNEDGVEFFSHDINSNFSGSMDVYRIPKENLNAINYNSKLHTIALIGEAEYLCYDDYANKRLNIQKSQRKFYSNTAYHILLAFDNEEKIVTDLKTMAKNGGVIC